MLTRLQTDRSPAYLTIFLFWCLVAEYAVAHDQYVARIEPRHFTRHHEPVTGVGSANGLAAVHAVYASVGPGLLLALGCVVAATTGPRPPLGRRFIIRGVLAVLVLTETAALFSAFRVSRMQSSFLPGPWFPESTLSIVLTQTIQFTSYLAGGVFSCVLLATMVWYRFCRSPRS
jgi:hypothetical protein